MKKSLLIVVCFIVISLAWFLNFSFKDLDKTGGSFLSEEYYKIVNNQHDIYAFKIIDGMVGPPTSLTLISIEKDSYTKLTPDQSKRLIELLKQSNDLDIKERISQCQYKPGAFFYFECDSEDHRCIYRAGKRWLEVAVCFNCNIWAMNRATQVENNFVKHFELKSDQLYPVSDEERARRIENYISNEILEFGDFIDQRENLEELVKEIFGENFFGDSRR